MSTSLDGQVVVISGGGRGLGEDPRYAALMRKNKGEIVPYVARTSGFFPRPPRRA